MVRCGNHGEGGAAVGFASHTSVGASGSRRAVFVWHLTGEAFGSVWHHASVHHAGWATDLAGRITSVLRLVRPSSARRKGTPRDVLLEHGRV
jgi:hypothetical protein